MARVAIVGGGIAGLAAAVRLADVLGGAVEVTVVDRADRLGGKLRTGAIRGRTVETVAETFLAREADDPSGAPSAAVRFARRLGLGDAIIHPATTAAAILHDGELVPMPAGTLMGVPADLVTTAAALGVPAAPPDADADRGGPVLGPDADVSVGALVRDRLGATGDAIVDRLVDPLLGGVYAGRADRLSVAVTMPGLAAALRSAHTLQAGVRATLALRAPAPGPVFAGIDGGLSRLVDAAAAASGATVRLGRPIAALAGAPGGYRLTLGTVRGTGRGATRAPEWLDVDAVLLAVPSRPASRLLDGIAPAPAALVGELDYASIGLVTYVLPPGALDGTGLDGRSGALVPAVEGRLVKAVTVFSTKWSPQPDGAVLLRVSIGRHGEEAPLRYDDASLAALALDDLGKIAGRPLPAPWHAMVTRLGGALPQYAPGHLDRVARARAGLPATIALAGAAYDGVGIPACIRSGQRAADQLIGALRQ